MSELATCSFFGVALTLACYLLCVRLRSRTGLALLNPILTAAVLIIVLLSAADIDYAAYKSGASLISALLTPATICLAVPLYEQVALLRRHRGAIMAGVLAGVLSSLVCVLLLSWLFGLDHAAYVTLLPKSITTAIGMGVSEKLGGHVSITVASIIMTGILGNMTAGAVCRVLRITEPVARGVAIGSASHAIGTARAMEMGRVEGAMSSLSIVVCGLLTVVLAPVFAAFL